MGKEAVVVAAVVTTAATIVGVVVLVRKWKHRSERRWRTAQQILRKLANDSATPVAKLWQVAGELAPDGDWEKSNSSLCKIVSNLAAPLPTGEEKGTFYGINLRGTDIVIVRARLEGKNESVSELRRQEIEIPSSIMGSTKEICNFVALELAKFISLHSETDSDKSLKGRTLGFTISYPSDQCPAFSGIHLKWHNLLVDDTAGKEFENDVNQALENHGVDMRVVAVVKDTIGHLAGGQYYNKESVAAVSLGTGTDVAYIQSPQLSPRSNNISTNSAETVFNMQWGNFSSTHLPLTEYDVALDAESTNPRERIFEKLISGMCLGDIVRRVLLKMAQEAALFGDNVPPKLRIPYILRPFDMAAMHQDTSEDYEIVDDKLKQVFEINNSTPMVREIVTEVCDIVTERGARLVGAGIVEIMESLTRIKTRRSVVTVEGGLYDHYRIFRNYLHSSVWEMIGSDHSNNVVIEHCHGGSAVGSIFLAASHTRNANP